MTNYYEQMKNEIIKEVISLILICVCGIGICGGFIYLLIK